MIDYASMLFGFGLGGLFGLLTGIWIWGDSKHRAQPADLHEPLADRLLRSAVKRGA
jgi:hypothetical protein